MHIATPVSRQTTPASANLNAKPRDREIRKPPVAAMTSAQHQHANALTGKPAVAKPPTETHDTAKVFDFKVKVSNVRAYRRQVVATSNKGRRPEQSVVARR